MAFFLPSPSAVVELSRYAVGQVVETAAAAATVPVRVFALLSQAELLVNRIALVAERAEAIVERADSVAERAESLIGRVGAVAERAESLIGRVGAVVDEADETVVRTRLIMDAAAVAVEEADLVSKAASAVVLHASTSAGEAGALLEQYAPILRTAGPLAEQFVNELTPEEVHAAIRMIDELPRLREHLTNDVMPLLGKLDQVGPDLHSLLEVTSDLHLAIAGIPGLRMLRRRGEQKADDEDAANGR